ncbi:endolytic transglycosylase MltG [Legionella waltersii]|uniref:Endolytic murein transglycosylase n=1 Tax=Legionella waltersii TaxID=66969 RepID=A0A0W1ALY8_9GAMM|nr:endolytic transglycosylase MltG [Legionella waltersii]KTD82302.1 periplasmic solute-binding protein [Legionella waltersii]SNV04164.1 putative periplasmic solute-binding protein [Legionella waltersii]
MQWINYKKSVSLIFLTLFIGIAVSFWQVNRMLYVSMLPENASPTIITIDRSTTAYQLAYSLQNKQLIPSARALLWVIRYKDLAHRLKAGVYQIAPGDTPMSLLEKIVNGAVIVQYFAIIEGSTQKKVDEDLRKANYLFYQPEAWSIVQGKYSNAEGLLLADTYQYQGGSGSEKLLLQAHNSLIAYLNNCWNSRDDNLPYKTPYELLIAASIIEKEASIPAERKLISGVMINRLRKKMPLQMDPTVIYGLGNDYQKKLTHNDLLIPSPYNSYLNRGLPPTPIAMVGKESIDAAAHPQLSNYLYYVAKGDGSHQFSETYEQQKQAINQFRRKDH